MEFYLQRLLLEIAPRKLGFLRSQSAFDKNQLKA